VSTNFTQVLGQFLLDDCCMSIFFYLTLCVSVSDSFIHPFDDVVRGFFDDVLSIMIKGKVFLNFQLIDVSDDMIYLPGIIRVGII